jgi:diaminopimelate epimerase
VIFVDNVDLIDLPVWGRMIENHCLFPEKTNVEFVQILQDDRFKMRVWERGTGETLACGTGACATLVAAILNGYTAIGKQAAIQLPGGGLDIKWDAETKHVYMTGDATMVFEGNYEL